MVACLLLKSHSKKTAADVSLRGILNSPEEISDAGWFDASNHPQLPFPLSLSRLMIDAFFENHPRL
jgi:hypothetical protein